MYKRQMRQTDVFLSNHRSDAWGNVENLIKNEIKEISQRYASLALMPSHQSHQSR